MKEKSAARLTIHKADTMTPQGRKDVALWLRRQAAFLVRRGANFSSRFTANYMYR